MADSNPLGQAERDPIPSTVKRLPLRIRDNGDGAGGVKISFVDFSATIVANAIFAGTFEFHWVDDDWSDVRQTSQNF
tara:strand:- start:3259 stop:3489 length:231 start_codon:yes stop_codon:yes gene_type:complete